MRLFLPCLFLLLALNGKAQTTKQHYDFEFKGFNPCNWDWMKSKKNCNIFYNAGDSTGALQISYKTKPWVEKLGDMEFKLGKSIILPSINYRKLTVSLSAVNSSHYAIFLTVVGIDKNENILFIKKDSLKNSSSWTDVVVVCPSKKTKAVNIYIQYKGNALTDQVIKLQNLSVKLDGMHLSAIGRGHLNADKAELSPPHIVPLNSKDSVHLLDNIKEIKNKKIIGLGECAHGSLSIANAQVLFLQNLVTRNKCKLVLLEMPFDFAMLIDLYIQGLTPDSSKTIVNGYLKLSTDSKPMMLFLKWVRKYNAQTDRKVHVLGIDNSSFGGRPMALMDYHSELLGEVKSEAYLRKLYSNQIGDVIEIAREDSYIQTILGKQNYAYYIYALSDIFSKNRAVRFSKRDLNMAARVAFLDSLFTKPNEKTVILAHSKHLQRTKWVSDQYNATLGNLLSNKYGNEYYALDFNIGFGKFTQDSCYSNLSLINDSLKFTPKNSFAHAAMQTGFDFFFYPSKRIDENINLILSVTRYSQNKNDFEFANLRKRFDGYVFIRKSEAFTHIERKPFAYAFDLFSGKRKKYKELMEGFPKEP